MEKEYNKDDIDFGAIEGDFHSFVSQGNFEGAEAILDNLKDLGEWEKATELLIPFFKAKMMKRMVVPADYGEEKKKTFMPCLVKDRENGGEMEVMVEGVW